MIEMTALGLLWRPVAVGLLLMELAACGQSTTNDDTGGDTPEAGDSDADADADSDAEAEATGDADDGTTRRPHGDPCTAGTDCLGGFCLDTTLLPAFVDGYCTAMGCDPSFPGACGDDAECFDVELGFPLCASTCTTDADCRPPDYVCVGTCIPDDFTASLERPGTLTGSEADLTAFVAAVDDDRMMGRVRILAGEDPWDSPTGPVTIRSRATLHPDHATALGYLEAELTATGATVERLAFDGGLTNLVAELAGTNPGLAPVLVTAHWDSTASKLTTWTPETDPAPGAVDNGSGVAVALEVASILATPTIAQPPRTVRIVLFDAEEVGLLGSEDYVTTLTTGGETIGCVVNADMIGWAMPPTAGRFWYVFDEASRSWAGLGLEAIELFVPTARPITTNYGDAGRSNSTSFWAGGMCAVGLSCWPRDPSNHTPDDTSATFQPAVFHDTSRGALAVAAAWMYSTTDP